MIRKSRLLRIMFAILALSPLCCAQDKEPSVDSTIEVVRADMLAEKVTIISAAMDFSDHDAAAFWPIYRRYEYERFSLDDRRAAVIKEYTEKYPTVTDAEAKAMAEQMFDYDSHVTALKRRYFKKFNKALPALTVTKFFQLDRRIDLMMDMRVEAALPPLTRPVSAKEEEE